MENILSDRDAELLVYNLAVGKDGDYFTEAEGDVVIEWAKETMVNMSLLSLILSHKVLVGIVDDEVVFSKASEEQEQVLEDGERVMQSTDLVKWEVDDGEL